MTEFTKKELQTPLRVCYRIKEQRLQKNIGLDIMVKRTRISKKYIEALEDCRFSDIPFAPLYQKNFIKSYLEALNIEPAPFVNQFLEEEVKTTHKTKIKPSKNVKKNYLHNLPNILRYGTIIAFAALLLTYVGFQVHNILTPPTLTILTPQDGIITNEKQINIKGETDKETEVYINGTAIKHSEQGQFQETIDLVNGVNSILITAKNKHGKTTNIERHIILKDSQQFSLR